MADLLDIDDDYMGGMHRDSDFLFGSHGGMFSTLCQLANLAVLLLVLWLAYKTFMCLQEGYTVSQPYANDVRFTAVKSQVGATQAYDNQRPDYTEGFGDDVNRGPGRVKLDQLAGQLYSGN